MAGYYAVINSELCIGCTACKDACPVGAIRVLAGWRCAVINELCIGCGRCREICHRAAPKLTAVKTM